VAVEGWRPVEDLVRWGFEHAPVVMANEAHNGLARCIRTREVGIRMIQAAHEAGVRRLAMEALPWPAEGTPGPIHALPPAHGGYLAQPDMRGLMGAALELGWRLWAYEAVFDVAADADPAELLTMEFTNWREREQAGPAAPGGDPSAVVADRDQRCARRPAGIGRTVGPAVGVRFHNVTSSSLTCGYLGALLVMRLGLITCLYRNV